jgi:hypothetical protein
MASIDLRRCQRAPTRPGSSRGSSRALSWTAFSCPGEQVRPGAPPADPSPTGPRSSNRQLIAVFATPGPSRPTATTTPPLKSEIDFGFDRFAGEGLCRRTPGGHFADRPPSLKSAILADGAGLAAKDLGTSPPAGFGREGLQATSEGPGTACSAATPRAAKLNHASCHEGADGRTPGHPP